MGKCNIIAGSNKFPDCRSQRRLPGRKDEEELNDGWAGNRSGGDIDELTRGGTRTLDDTNFQGAGLMNLSIAGGGPKHLSGRPIWGQEDSLANSFLGVRKELLVKRSQFSDQTIRNKQDRTGKGHSALWMAEKRGPTSIMRLKKTGRMSKEVASWWVGKKEGK